MICKLCGKAMPTQNKRMSTYVDELLSQSFEGWSKEAKKGYITACETLIHKDYYPGVPVTYDDFFICSKGTFVECVEPTTEPDYNSIPTVLGNTSSKYWYGTDEGGAYIIRKANHWCLYYINDYLITSQANKIAKCVWHYRFLDMNSIKGALNFNVPEHYTGKIYLAELRHGSK